LYCTRWKWSCKDRIRWV